MEEERRLCYVGMTRAEDRLYLTRSVERARGNYQRFPNFNGDEYYVRPSQFLADIPEEFTTSNRFQKIQRFNKVNSSRKSPIVEPAEIARDRKPPFADGEKVNHPIFGDGTVVNSKSVGVDFEIAVAFKLSQHGLKRLLYSYARLTSLE